MVLRIAHAAERTGWGRYLVSVWLDGSGPDLDEIESIQYLLHPSFADPVRSASDRGAFFRLSFEAGGDFLLRATLRFRAGRSVQLKQWLCLESAGESRDERTGHTDPGEPCTLFLSCGLGDADACIRLRHVLEGEMELSVVESYALPASDAPVTRVLEMEMARSAGVVFLVSDLRSPWMQLERQIADHLGIPSRTVAVGSAVPGPRGPELRIVASDPEQVRTTARELARWARTLRPPAGRRRRAETDEPGTATFFLSVAERVGRRVASAAVWDGEAAAWGPPGTASPTLYGGGAGIAVFLAELHAAVGAAPDDELARAALGGIRFALNRGAALSGASFGFHSGRTGIAWAAAVVARLLNHPELLEQALELLRPLVGREGSDRYLDAIAGGGGAIPPLLQMAEWLSEPEVPRGIALRLGEALIASAQRETHGWGWSTSQDYGVRHLCGYAHGAAGIAHGLLELWHATGDSRFLYAAEQGFLYERQFFSSERSNWQDLRHREIGEYLREGRLEDLKERLRSGHRISGPPPGYVLAWCHGAPGIGLTRLRAWQLTGDAVYLDEARAAMNATVASLRAPATNYSLCHGHAGNSEILLVAASVLGEPEHRMLPREAATAGWREYEQARHPWPSGTRGGTPDPGLMLGESGLGYWLLRLARPETPSVLLVTAPRGGEPDGDAGYMALRAETLARYFGRTMRLLQALGVDTSAADLQQGAERRHGRSDVEEAHARLVALVRAEADPGRRALMEDAFRLDREKYELSRSVTDFTVDFLNQLVRPSADDVRWREARFSLSPRIRVVRGEHDWDEWLEQRDAEAGPPDPSETFHVIRVVAGAQVGTRRLSPFAALVLQSLQASATLDEIVSRVEEAVSSDGRRPDREWLEDRVVEQLSQAHRTRALVVETVPAGVPA